MCIYVYVYMYVYVCAFGNQKSALGIFFSHSPLCLLSFFYCERVSEFGSLPTWLNWLTNEL